MNSCQLTPRVLEEGLSDLVAVLNEELWAEVLDDMSAVGRRREEGGIELDTFGGGGAGIAAVKVDRGKQPTQEGKLG